MRDPKSENEVQRFEKEVQQKMEELEFSPSTAVWANVELAVKKEKRRRVPFFWLFFLPALLVGGARIYYLSSSHSGTTGTAKNAPVAAPSASPSTVSAGADRRVATPSAPVVDQLSTGVSRPATPASLHNRPATALSPVISPETTPSAAGTPAAATSHATAITPSGVTTPATISTSSAVTPSEKNLLTSRPDRRIIMNDRHTAGRLMASHTHRTQEKGLIGTPAPVPSGVELVAKDGQDGDNKVAEITASTDAVAATKEAAKAGIRLHPVSLHNIPGIVAAPLAPSAAKMSLKKTNLSPKRPWEAGFAGGIGISSLHQALFKQSPATLNTAGLNFSAPTTITNTAAQTYTTKIQPDLSFWAGIFVQKPILKNVSVSVGLNLHYYSTKLTIGDKVSNTSANYFYSPSAYLLSGAAASGPGQSFPYYTTGDKQTFINRYYFLEIPVSLQWQITHSRVMPLFWEAGFSLSYLMSSNALYYNTHAGVFYKDGDVTNKTQFNISTALMAGIPFKGVNLQVGPQIQYGLTSLLNTGSGGQHFFYGGVKVVVFPGKSHKAGKRLFRGQDE